MCIGSAPVDAVGCAAGEYGVSQTLECKGTASSAPSCEVSFSSLPVTAATKLTIEVAQTDFNSGDEYVSAVKVSGQRIGGTYLTSGGSQERCDLMPKILDEVQVPAGSISQSGVLTVRIETSSGVNFGACNGIYLYAKVTILPCNGWPTVLLGPPSAYPDQAGHNFGASVSVGERFAVVGAPGADAAFVFQIVPLNAEAVATLEAPDKTTGDSFGQAVSLGAGGGWIAVGAPYKDEGASSNKGAVYVFQQDAAGAWLYHSKITSSLAVANDRFGWSVSLDEVPGSYVRVLVGCDYRANYSGFVEVFELSPAGTWTMVWNHTIGGHGAKYGYSVSLSGDFLAVGSWSDNFEYKNDQGTIFCYTRNADGSWSDRGKTGGGAWGRSNSSLKVGWSVSQDNGYQVAGVPGDSSNRGAAYVRLHVQEDLNGDGNMSDSGETVSHAKGFVVEPDTVAGDLFGTSVALKWPYLLVGAPSHGNGGASFLYEFNAMWHKVKKLDPAAYNLSMQAVGTSVALSDGLALTGGAGRAILQFRNSSQVDLMCTPGQIVVHVSHFTRCVECPAGSYQHDMRATSCIYCVAGKYAPVPGGNSSDACIDCTVGKFAGSPGANSSSSCADCHVGKFTTSTGSTTCVECDAGYYMTVTEPSIANCTPCAPGTFHQRALNPPEASRTYSSIYNNDAIGTGHAQSMLDSVTGQAWSALSNAAGEWMMIDLGSVMRVQGVMIQARQSSVWDQHVTELEVQHSLHPDMGFSSLQSETDHGSRFFPTATRSNGETSELIFKELVETRYIKIIVWSWHGHISMRAGVLGAPQGCVSCPAGKFAESSASAMCEDCVAGKYSTAEGANSSSVCTECVEGKFSATVGADSPHTCLDCIAGKYSSLSAMTVCIGCVAGKYSTAEGANSSSVCTECVAGKFSATVSASSCLDCIAGKYSNDLGSTVCSNCDVGKYSDETGAVSEAVCLDCSAGTYASGATVTLTCGGSCGEGCTPSVDVTSGTLSDGPDNYGNGENCWWLMATTPGAEIRVSFPSFDTESGYDYISIYRCISSSCSSSELILRHAGSLNASNVSTSVTGFLKVQFTSDGSVTRSGFTGSWSLSEGSGSSSSCSDCVAGKYSSVSGASSCLTCQANTTSTAGSTACVCDRGYTMSAERCASCEAGKFKNHSGNGPCDECLEGTFSPDRFSAFWSSKSIRVLELVSAPGDVTIPRTTSLNLHQKSFSWALWVKRVSTSTNDWIITIDSPASTNERLHIGYRSNGKFSFAFYGNDLDSSGTYIDVGVWVHWAGTFSYGSSHARILYRNGRQEASDTPSSSYSHDKEGGSMVIGPSGHMYLDDLLILTRILSLTEIASLHQSCGILDKSGLVMRFTFEQSIISTTTVQDTSGRNNHGVISGYKIKYIEAAFVGGPCSAPMPATKCIPCAAGSYTPVTGATVCIECEPGKHSLTLGAVSEAMCILCALGKYSAASGVRLCSDCPAGTYANASGATSMEICYDCTAGKFSPVLGATSITTCADCSQGSFSTPGSTACNTCVDGKFAWSGPLQVFSVSLSFTSRALRSEGYLIDGDTLSSSWTSAPHIDVFSCSTNVYVELDLGRSVWIDRIVRWLYHGDVRQYCNQKAAVSSSGAFSGEETVVFSCSSYADCGSEMSSGKTISFGALQARYVRYYSSRNNRNGGVHFLELEVWSDVGLCVDCESGKYSKPGSTVCEDCGTHSTSESGSSACNMCTAGYTRTSEGCVECEIGTFKNYAGNDPCTPHCPPGTFVALSSATSLSDGVASSSLTSTPSPPCSESGSSGVWTLVVDHLPLHYEDMNGTWRGPSSATFSIVEARYEDNYEDLKSHEMCGPKIRDCLERYAHMWGALGFIVKETSSGDCVMSLHCHNTGAEIVTQDFTPDVHCNSTSKNNSSPFKCVPCTTGTFSSSATVTCTMCPAGTYSAVVGAVSNASCLPCSPGSSSLPGSTNVSDCKCIEGYTGPDGGACTPSPSNPLAFFVSSEDMAHCELGLTWKQLLLLRQHEKGRISTGGLGKKLMKRVKVWVCDRKNECSQPDNPMCFVFDEFAQVFIPWGLKGKVLSG